MRRVERDGRGRVWPHLPLPTYPLSKTMKWISQNILNLPPQCHCFLGVNQYCNLTHFSMFWISRCTHFECKAENRGFGQICHTTHIWLPTITDDRSEELRHSNLDCGNLRPIPLPAPYPSNRSLPEQIYTPSHFRMSQTGQAEVHAKPIPPWDLRVIQSTGDVPTCPPPSIDCCFALYLCNVFCFTFWLCPLQEPLYGSSF